MLPKITVVTVVRNAVNTIEQTMLSVLNQTYSNIEYIIVDGASTDGTKEIITNYELRITNYEFPNIVSFKFISEPDKGIYDAMNKGIDLATGEFIYFLGADDILINTLHIVASQLKHLNTVYYGNVFLTKSCIYYAGKFNKYKLACQNICHQAIFYPLYILKRYLYDTQYKVYADYKLNIKCWGDKDVKFSYIPITITKYNNLGFSFYNVDELFEKNKKSLICESLGNIPYLYSCIRYKISRLKRYMTN